MGSLYQRHFAARKAYEAYAASLLASDNHWEVKTWDQVCHESEFVEAWRQAAKAAHVAIEQLILDTDSYEATD
jgi:hypothetical protein